MWLLQGATFMGNIWGKNVPESASKGHFKLCVEEERKGEHLPKRLKSHPAQASGTQTENNVIMMLCNTYTVHKHATSLTNCCYF